MKTINRTNLQSDKWAWSANETYLVNSLVVYNGITYKNLTGTNTATTPNLDTTNWVSTAYVPPQIQYANSASFPATGDLKVIYVAQDTNKAYRWNGTSYTGLYSFVTINNQTTSYTLQASDAENIIAINSSSATNLTLSGLTTGQSVRVYQLGTGQITCIAGTLTPRNTFGLVSTAGQYSIIEITVIGTDAVLSGNLA